MRTEQLPPYTYRWDDPCFPLGADSLALGDFCTVKPGDRVLDLGCGAGLLLLLCARRGAGTLCGVEADPHAADLCRQNLRENGLTGDSLTADLRQVPLPQADLVITNPPWYPLGQKGDAAHVETCPLPDWCAAGAKALPHRGRFAVVYPPERLVDLLIALRGAGLEPKRLRLCRHAPDKPPYAALVEAVKGGKPQLSFEQER